MAISLQHILRKYEKEKNLIIMSNELEIIEVKAEKIKISSKFENILEDAEIALKDKIEKKLKDEVKRLRKQGFHDEEILDDFMNSFKKRFPKMDIDFDSKESTIKPTKTDVINLINNFGLYTFDELIDRIVLFNNSEELIDFVNKNSKFFNEYIDSRRKKKDEENKQIAIRQESEDKSALMMQGMMQNIMMMSIAKLLN